MLKIGTGELLVILMAALIIFGPSRLPALGKMAGKAIGTLRHYADSSNWDEFMEDEEEDKPAKKEPSKEQEDGQVSDEEKAQEKNEDMGDDQAQAS